MITDISNINNPEWQARSLCQNYDPRIFVNKGNGNLSLARRICSNCPVATECLNWILLMEKHGHTSSAIGVYAGTTPNQRKRMPICYYGQCLEPVKNQRDFCSNEHKKLHKASLRQKPEYTYHKQGRIADSPL